MAEATSVEPFVDDLRKAVDSGDACKLAKALEAVLGPAKAASGKYATAIRSLKGESWVPAPSDEELATIKARTMHDLIKLVDGGRKRVLFLTGNQPATIAQSPQSIKQMLRIFAGDSVFDLDSDRRPQLVINLLFSGGFHKYTKHCTKGTMSFRSRSWAAGMCHGRAPFLGQPDDGVPSEATDTEEIAESRIDRFMENCLVPLAIRTRAVVLCDALSNQNVLSASFSRISAVMCQKFGNQPPFTVISATNDTVSLYCSTQEHPDELTGEMARELADWVAKTGENDDKAKKVKEAKIKANYSKYKPGSFWRSVVEQIPEWQQRDAALWADIVERHPQSMGQTNDLDKNAQNLIVAHSSHSGKLQNEYLQMMTSINRFLLDDLGLPGVALKTGFSQKRKHLTENQGSGPDSLRYCVDLVQSGLPTVFLDVRSRPELGAELEVPSSPLFGPGSGRRAALISAAMAKYEQWCDALKAEGLADTFDACTLAYFHVVLMGDGKSSTVDFTGEASPEFDVCGVSLWRAIELLRIKERVLQTADGNSRGGEVGSSLLMKLRGSRTLPETEKHLAELARTIEDVQMPPPLEKSWRSMSRLHVEKSELTGADSKKVDPGDAMPLTRATSEQVHTLAAWIAHRHFEDAFELLPKEARGSHTDAAEFFKDQIYVHTVCSRMLLASPNFYHLNMCKPEDAVRLMNRLIKLDRLPRQNSIEGLLLLDRAWSDHDVARHMATRYKYLCKALFVAQLLLGWVAVVATIPQRGASGGNAITGFEWLEFLYSAELADAAPSVVFGVSLALSFVASLDAMLNSRSRWRLLRAAAQQLEATVWMYRTRTGDFALNASGRAEDGRAEKQLRVAICAVRQELHSSANLSQTAFVREYPRRIFVHHQTASRRSADGNKCAPSLKPEEDDFQSPVVPELYVPLRIDKMLEFYQGRVPRYARRSFAFKVMVGLLGIASSILAYMELLDLVVLTATATTALMSWVEFSGIASKTERYTRAVGALRSLLDWWESLSDVEKSSREAGEKLIKTTETILAEERSWQTVDVKKDSSGEGEAAGGADDEAKEEGTAWMRDGGSRRASKPGRFIGPSAEMVAC